MLRLHVSPAGDVGSLRATFQGWEGSGIAIVPLQNTALECRVRQSADQFELTVREALCPPGAAEDAWPLDFVSVLIERGACGVRVRLHCGQWGTCPVYLTCTDAGLWAHWDAVELYPLLSNTALSMPFAAHFLAGLDDVYAVDTVFPKIRRLTAGASAEWSAHTGAIDFTLPEPVAQPAPHTLAGGADVLGAVDRTLLACAARYKQENVTCGSLLSGGLDSAIVAIAASRVRPEQALQSFGMLVPRESQHGQKRRRRALVQQFGFHDTAIEAESHFCFDPNHRRIQELRVAPWDEFYYEAFEALLDAACRQGVQEMVTGNGGDELCLLHDFEAPNTTPADAAVLPPFLSPQIVQAYRDTRDSISRAPLALLPSSALGAASASAPLFSRKGVWSLSPLCTPELIRLCRRLPLEWRKNRRLWRDYLATLGVTQAVTHPHRTEDFGVMMEKSLRARAGFLSELFAGSLLADAGMLDASLLVKDFRRWCAGGALAYDVAHFMYVINLELGLRSMAARYAAPAHELVES